MKLRGRFLNASKGGTPGRRLQRAPGDTSKRRMLCVALLTLMLSLTCAAQQGRAGQKRTSSRSGIPRASRQIIVVTTANWEEVTGQLQRYERKGARSRWRQIGVPVAIVVGKRGMGWGAGLHRVETADGPVKKEGDGKSPAGVFALTTAFGYAPRAGALSLKLPYVPLDASVECVDDTQSVYYNRIVDNRKVESVDWHSSEKMRSVGEFYRWGVVVAHNSNPPQPGGGSCIFMHIWGGPGDGTSGCTAMPQFNLEEMLRWLDRSRHPVLVQLPATEYERLRKSWKLPAQSQPGNASH